MPSCLASSSTSGVMNKRSSGSSPARNSLAFSGASWNSLLPCIELMMVSVESCSIMLLRFWSTLRLIRLSAACTTRETPRIAPPIGPPATAPARPLSTASHPSSFLSVPTVSPAYSVISCTNSVPLSRNTDLPSSRVAILAETLPALSPSSLPRAPFAEYLSIKETTTAVGSDFSKSVASTSLPPVFSARVSAISCVREARYRGRDASMPAISTNDAAPVSVT